MRMATTLAVVSLIGGLVGCDSEDARSAGRSPTSTASNGNPATGDDAQPDPDEWHRVQREGSVNLRKEYDLSGLLVPEEEIHTLLERDAIPALTDPKLQAVSEIDWLDDTERVIVIDINGEVVAAPFRILNYHEVVNITVGGEPVAATFCPLCDSATLISRRVTRTDKKGREKKDVLEFGVSGALYNSNVIMYDRTDKGLWSQLGMKAISGPLAGTKLKHFPLSIVPFSEFRSEYPDAKVVSRENEFGLEYFDDPYVWVFTSPGTLVPVQAIGEELPLKTQGMGILSRGEAVFVSAEAIPADGLTVTTPDGEVELKRAGEGTKLSIRVVRAPEEVLTAQTFYYAWSAFNPKTRVIQ
jgi:uncharacterized protein DUF3179